MMPPTLAGEFSRPRNLETGQSSNGAAARSSRLSPRERQIVALLSEGCPNQQIADRLGLRLQTVKRSNRNAGAAIELLRAGRVPAALVTHRLPLGATPNAFEMLAAYSDGVGKIIIEL